MACRLGDLFLVDTIIGCNLVVGFESVVEFNFCGNPSGG